MKYLYSKLYIAFLLFLASYMVVRFKANTAQGQALPWAILKTPIQSMTATDRKCPGKEDCSPAFTDNL